ncbi:MAG: hypothetical protein BGO28_02670 [Alphaproteobacteria bacterium 43-37]|nr:MAG: hypothetical protein BGO28_02670 [Alphaproteobacteria bacterium 43-37]
MCDGYFLKLFLNGVCEFLYHKKRRVAIFFPMMMLGRFLSLTGGLCLQELHQHSHSVWAYQIIFLSLFLFFPISGDRI